MNVGDQVNLVKDSLGKWIATKSDNARMGDMVKLVMGSEGNYKAIKSSSTTTNSEVILTMSNDGKWVAHKSGVDNYFYLSGLKSGVANMEMLKEDFTLLKNITPTSFIIVKCNGNYIFSLRSVFSSSPSRSFPLPTGTTWYYLGKYDLDMNFISEVLVLDGIMSEIACLACDIDNVYIGYTGGIRVYSTNDLSHISDQGPSYTGSNASFWHDMTCDNNNIYFSHITNVTIGGGRTNMYKIRKSDYSELQHIVITLPEMSYACDGTYLYTCEAALDYIMKGTMYARDITNLSSATGHTITMYNYVAQGKLYTDHEYLYNTSNGSTLYYRKLSDLGTEYSVALDMTGYSITGVKVGYE
jgi:hypothetical protein